MRFPVFWGARYMLTSFWPASNRPKTTIVCLHHTLLPHTKHSLQYDCFSAINQECLWANDVYASKPNSCELFLQKVYLCLVSFPKMYSIYNNFIEHYGILCFLLWRIQKAKIYFYPNLIIKWHWSRKPHFALTWAAHHACCTPWCLPLFILRKRDL